MEKDYYSHTYNLMIQEDKHILETQRNSPIDNIIKIKSSLFFTSSFILHFSQFFIIKIQQNSDVTFRHKETCVKLCIGRELSFPLYKNVKLTESQ